MGQIINLYANILFVLFGTPNAGKGTAAKALMKEWAHVPFVYLSTGDYIRYLLGRIKEATDSGVPLTDKYLLGLKGKLEHTNTGDLFCPDEYPTLLRHAIASTSLPVGEMNMPPFLLDGGLRTFRQLEEVKSEYYKIGYRRFVILNFRLPKILEWDARREGRFQMFGREDDKPIPAAFKLVEHLKSEEQVLPHCEAAGYELVHINPLQTPEKVLDELMLTFRNKFGKKPIASAA